MARRDDREYREYLSEEQRSQRGPQRGSRVGVERGCIARRMQPDFRHGLLTSIARLRRFLYSSGRRRSRMSSHVGSHERTHRNDPQALGMPDVERGPNQCVTHMAAAEIVGNLSMNERQRVERPFVCKERCVAADRQLEPF